MALELSSVREGHPPTTSFSRGATSRLGNPRVSGLQGCDPEPREPASWLRRLVGAGPGLSSLPLDSPLVLVLQRHREAL